MISVVECIFINAQEARGKALTTLPVEIKSYALHREQKALSQNAQWYSASSNHTLKVKQKCIKDAH